MTTKTTAEPEPTTPPRGSGCCGPMRWTCESPRDILDRRYASGELTKEQYEAMRRDLEQSRS